MAIERCDSVFIERVKLSKEEKARQRQRYSEKLRRKGDKGKRCLVLCQKLFLLLFFLKYGKLESYWKNKMYEYVKILRNQEKFTVISQINPDCLCSVSARLCLSCFVMNSQPSSCLACFSRAPLRAQSGPIFRAWGDGWIKLPPFPPPKKD